MHGVLINVIFPYIDFVYSVAFPIGIVLALFGNFVIVGPMTLAVLPLNMLLSAVMFHLSRQSFREVGLRVRTNRLGYLGYLLTTSSSCRRSRSPATHRSCSEPAGAGRGRPPRRDQAIVWIGAGRPT